MTLELEILLNARAKGVYVHTYEESRFEKELIELVTQENYNVFTYSASSGLKDLKGESILPIPPSKIISTFEGTMSDSLLLIKDIHDIWNNPVVKRAIRDFLEKDIHSRHLMILFISPVIDIPIEIEKLVSFYTYELPSREDIKHQIIEFNEQLKEVGVDPLEGKELAATENALVGMTFQEAILSIKKSIVRNGFIKPEDISKEKEEVIRKTGILEYISKEENPSNIGGLDILKDWLADAEYSFEKEAQEVLIDQPKGILLTGFPGTGKSLTAQAISSMWNLPLLKLDMSHIINSRLGESEKNIRRALELAEAVSPCVLWIDEIEKTLAGGDGSSGDSGTTRRMLSSILTWMNDRESPVFIVATANDITSLPPELTRAGRFDEIFYLGLPGQEERKEILNIHLKKRGYNPEEIDNETMNSLSEALDGYSGAEIEQVVITAARKKYADYKKEKEDTYLINDLDITNASERIIPLSSRTPELISYLREWAKYSAVCASTEEHNIVHQISEDNDFEEMIDDLLD